MFYSFDSLILVYGKYTLKQVSIETLGIYNVMVDIELVYHNRAYFTAECFSEENSTGYCFYHIKGPMYLSNAFSFYSYLTELFESNDIFN